MVEWLINNWLGEELVGVRVTVRGIPYHSTRRRMQQLGNYKEEANFMGVRNDAIGCIGYKRGCQLTIGGQTAHGGVSRWGCGSGLRQRGSKPLQTPDSENEKHPTFGCEQLGEYDGRGQRPMRPARRVHGGATSLAGEMTLYHRANLASTQEANFLSRRLFKPWAGEPARIHSRGGWRYLPPKKKGGGGQGPKMG